VSLTYRPGLSNFETATNLNHVEILSYTSPLDLIQKLSHDFVTVAWSVYRAPARTGIRFKPFLSYRLIIRTRWASSCRS